MDSRLSDSYGLILTIDRLILCICDGSLDKATHYVPIAHLIRPGAVPTAAPPNWDEESYARVVQAIDRMVTVFEERWDLTYPRGSFWSPESVRADYLEAAKRGIMTGPVLAQIINGTLMAPSST